MTIIITTTELSNNNCLYETQAFMDMDIYRSTYMYIYGERGGLNAYLNQFYGAFNCGCL